jgi:hypothetical protein
MQPEAAEDEDGVKNQPSSKGGAFFCDEERVWNFLEA